jgi:hypothetical protein
MPAKHLSVLLEPRVGGAVFHLHQTGERSAPFKHYNPVGAARIRRQPRLIGARRDILELFELGI